jgi:enoyl-CoA hydratase/carnithine racemase
MSQYIRSEARDGVFHIEIARPEKKNALTADMYQALAEALARAEADPAVRVILISAPAATLPPATTWPISSTIRRRTKMPRCSAS